MVNVLGIELPDLPYSVLGAVLLLVGTIVGFARMADEPVAVENRRRYFTILGALLLVAYGAINDGFLPAGTLPIEDSMILGLGLALLGLSGIIDMIFPEG